MRAIIDGFKKENYHFVRENSGPLRMVAIDKLKLTFVVFSVSDLQALGSEGLRGGTQKVWVTLGDSLGKALILREWKVPFRGRGGSLEAQ